MGYMMSYLSQRLGLTRFEADEYYAQALDAYDNQDLEDAIDKIGFAITLLPVNSEYYAVRGMFYMQDDIPDKARDNFEQALQIHDGEMLALYGMGVLAFRDKAWEAALKWFTKARAINPMQAETPYYLALVYHRQQDNQTAKTYMQQAAQLMEAADDKRKRDANKWIKKFDDLIKQAQQQDDMPVRQPELPLTDQPRQRLPRPSVTERDEEPSSAEQSASKDDNTG